MKTTVQNKKQKVVDLLLTKSVHFSLTEEDITLLQRLWNDYWKKRNGDIKSSVEVLTAALLWRYSSDNYLWESNKDCSLKSISSSFEVKSKTVGNNASLIRKELKIDNFDDRYCRKEIAESNPLKQFAMLESGLIVEKESAISKGIPFVPLKKDKEDYFYDGMEHLDMGDAKKAKYNFRKSLELDPDYIDAYYGLGTLYFDENLKKSKEYFEKAYTLTKNHFKGIWPKSLIWGIIDNRQYLTAIHGYGLSLWREGNREQALQLFLLLLKLNPCDNQGVRYLVGSIYAGKSWEDCEEQDRDKQDRTLEKQNKIHNFWQYDEDDVSLWEEGEFVELIDPESVKEKMETFDKGHDEHLNYVCKNCNTKISAHNKDWHDNLCDDCFNQKHHNTKI